MVKHSTLGLLSCPHCQSFLSLRDNLDNEVVDKGNLFCAECGRSFPIKNGIPQFINAGELEGSNLRFARQYDRLAPFYSLFVKAAFLPFGGDRKARKEILYHLDLKGGRLLEVSIGNGVNLPYLFENPNAGEVFGLDISNGQLKQCRKLIEKKGWDIDLFLGTAEKLPFQDASFESILHIGGINFFTGRQQAIEEVIRVAKPECKIIIADEAERLAKVIDGAADDYIPTRMVDLLPDTVEDIRCDDIWMMHGKAHGYCLSFRKPK